MSFLVSPEVVGIEKYADGDVAILLVDHATEDEVAKRLFLSDIELELSRGDHAILATRERRYPA